MSSWTSTKTGVAPVHATTSAVAAKVNVGQSTASPGFTPFAISTKPSASVPFAQDTTCLAPQNAERSASSCLDLGAHDVAAVIDDLEHGVVDGGAEPTPLRGKIDERNRVRHHTISSS